MKTARTISLCFLFSGIAACVLDYLQARWVADLVATALDPIARAFG